MSDFNLLNENNEEQYTPTPEDFVLTQADTKIHDRKFETKTTTFVKDALKRFCKNRSSVVAAAIIGLLILLAIFVPIFSPYDVENTDDTHGMLKPKVFEAGTGFWDGTREYSNISWNATQEAPEGFKKAAVIKYLEFKEGEMTDKPHINAKGGYFRLTTKKTSKEGADYKNIYYIENYTTFPITADGNYQVTIKLGNEDDIAGNKLGEYRVVLCDGKDNLGTLYGGENLLDWTSDHVQEDGVLTLNLSDYIAELGLDSVENGRVRIELARNTTIQYMLIESIMLSCDVEDEETQQLLTDISLDDANLQCMMVKGNDGKFPIGYWQASGQRNLYNASKVLVSFVYDDYEAKLGYQTNFDIGGSIMDEYIAKDWCDYDYEVGPSSFVRKSDKCPIVTVNEQTYTERLDVYNLDCDVIFYKYQGYDSMPKYIFGTTKIGEDIITLSFKSLRTSLIVAFLSSAVCLIFGLCWGAISGYFGGNVDLAMERFCEILSGVPYIVVMTLITLHFGNSIGIFALGLCITGWLGVAGRTRTQFYRFKGREYILASRTLGASDMRLIFKHILPNSLGTIITGSVLMIPGVIFSESSLSYLKLGLQGVKSFGTLLANNQQYIKTDAALILFPAAIISLLMISFNLFGNGLRDALNPSLKGSE